MNQFAADLENDLSDLKQKMADHSRAADSYFKGVMTQAEALKTKVEGAFEVISSEALVSPLFICAARYEIDSYVGRC